jgi:hypothetical protein
MKEINVNLELREVVMRKGGGETGSALCSIVNFRIDSVEPLGSTATVRYSDTCVYELTSSFSPKICLLSECPRITHFTPIPDIMAGLISPENKSSSISCKPEFIHTNCKCKGTR